MVCIRTVAYNSEKTLRRTIESVLNQTYPDFVYYICDNGSTDNGATKKIVEEYTKKDKRITAFYNKKNHVWDEENDRCKNFAKYLNDDDLYCQLDADDEYTPDFLQECIIFMQKNSLDIVCCGNDYIDSESNIVLRTRTIAQNLIVHQNDFSQYFTEYHQFMRTIWAHLYKAKIFKNYDWYAVNDNVPTVYGGDTYKNFEAFEKAESVGILAKVLHKYYISPTSVSYDYNPDRIKCDQILFKRGIDFLSRYGEISKNNYEFLFAVYFHAILDTVGVIAKAQISDFEKISDIKKIFSCSYTKEMLNSDNSNYINKLNDMRKSILEYALCNPIQENEETKSVAIKVIRNMYYEIMHGVDKKFLSRLIENNNDIFTCLTNGEHETALELIQQQPRTEDFAALELNLNKKINLSETELLRFWADIKLNSPAIASKLDADVEIKAILAKYPAINCINAQLAAAFCSTICFVIKGDPVSALKEFLSTPDVEINDDAADGYFLFAQNLTALANNSNAYLFFKKAWISYLIDCNRNKEAKSEIKDLNQLIPNDPELQKLIKQLNDINKGM